jgi:putative oxidoreductase
MLFALTIVAAVTMHDFWHYADAAVRAAEMAIFARDIAICGGLLMMIGMGPGPFAVDNRGKSPKR